MLRHILLLQRRPETTDAEIDASRDALAGLVGHIPGLLDFHWGPNVAPAERQGGFTHGFSMDFTDRAALDAYGPHPLHVPVATRVRAAFDKIVVFDFELVSR